MPATQNQKICSPNRLMSVRQFEHTAATDDVTPSSLNNHHRPRQHQNMPYQRMPERDAPLEPMCRTYRLRPGVLLRLHAAARHTAHEHHQQSPPLSSPSPPAAIPLSSETSVSSLRQQLSPYLIFKDDCVNDAPPTGIRFSCEYCGKTYGTRSSLNKHVRTHTLPCVCDTCGKAFSRMASLRNHVRTHTGEKPYVCSQCGRAFADQSNRRAHQWRSHYLNMGAPLGARQYSCLTCSVTVRTISEHVKHCETGRCRMARVRELVRPQHQQ